MPRVDFRTPRLFVDLPLAQGEDIRLDKAQGHYLANVLRLKSGDDVLVFNGRDGEWRARLLPGKRLDHLTLTERLRAQETSPDIHLAFAPLKHARLDYMVQKAVEMGVSRLVPVITRYTQVTRVNVERMRANVIEAAEQCGILAMPEVAEPLALDAYLAGREPERMVIFCDEAADVANPVAALGGHTGKPLSVLVGPEGGFAPEERERLLTLPNHLRLSLGPRVLRADTAAVAALAIVQSACGDWHPTT